MRAAQQAITNDQIADGLCRSGVRCSQTVTVMRTRYALLTVWGVGSLPLLMTYSSFSYLARAVTAVLAAVILLRLGSAPGRVTRVLFATALLAGVAAALTATAHLLLTGHPSAPGAAADWIYLTYGPIATAGLLMLPRHPSERPWRLRAITDAWIAVSSLAFLLCDPLLDMSERSGESLVVEFVAIGQPLVAVFMVAVLLAVLPRAQEQLRPFLRLAGAGLALLTLSDVGYSVGTLHGLNAPTAWPAVVEQAALLLLTAAALRSGQEVQFVVHERSPNLLETTAPFLAVLPTSVLALGIVVTGNTVSRPQVAIATVLGMGLFLRVLLASVDQKHTIDRLRKREADALDASRRDPLTGLANRAAVHETLASLLAEPDPRSVSLALLDLDDFKDINDTHGHDTGDAVLQELSRRLRLAAPEGALVARLGGDEFAVCVRTSQSAEYVGEALVAVFDEPVIVGTRRFCVTASVGVVLADAGVTPTPAVALSHVDVAMYQAKASKDPQRSGLVVLTGQARDHAAGRVRMRDEVSHPDLEQFHVVYQPVVDLSDGTVIGAEALLRWDHPVLGSVSPMEFIALAEQVGAISQLGEFALRTAAADLAGWLAEAEAAGRPSTRCAIGVNLSPRQLGNPDLCDLVRSVLAEQRLKPYRLVFEITEQALLDDWESAVEVVRELRAIGVGVAVDDFGTGYSSLRYLRRFDTSTLKIDREFVQAIADEPRTRVLVASVLEMARSLDLSSVAEGVETFDQLQVLRALGCDSAQGYLFDKPMRAWAFGRMLVGGHRYPVGTHRSLPVQPAQSGPRLVLPTSVPVVTTKRPGAAERRRVH
ncbi:MAG: hypothetical protein JWM02_2371 [Frankiales bacterium]|nr:hypothetical protein [Frankiales bacterium]